MIKKWLYNFQPWQGGKNERNQINLQRFKIDVGS